MGVLGIKDNIQVVSREAQVPVLYPSPCSHHCQPPADFPVTKNTHTHTRLMALFQDYPGEPVPER